MGVHLFSSLVFCLYGLSSQEVRTFRRPAGLLSVFMLVCHSHVALHTKQLPQNVKGKAYGSSSTPEGPMEGCGNPFLSVSFEACIQWVEDA